MTEAQIVDLVDRLRSEPAEAEWLEFKQTQVQPAKELGEYVSALSNGAALARRPFGFLVLGVHDKTHEVVGTTYNPRTDRVKQQDLLLWTTQGLLPRIHLESYEARHPGGRVVVFEIGKAPDQPVEFYGKAYIRVNSSKTLLANHPAKSRALWHLNRDWSAETVPNATLEDLDPEAIAKAREEYTEKNRHRGIEIATWDDSTFLNKAKVTRQGGITNAAILLLGLPESASLLSPAVARISWLLKDARNSELDYAHFGPPFILHVDAILERIRNLTVRTLPSGTLFPNEIRQYDEYVIREALHNAIAHQDYSLLGRIQIVETPNRLLITNVGSFLPGSVEQVIQQDAPQEIYRNPFLAEAMVNFNMIDTQGGGIKRMFQRQKERFFPLPDYDLSDTSRVAVNIPGQILDEEYTRLLMGHTDLDLWQVLLLDKVQKGEQIQHEAHRQLKSLGLIEGRYPGAYLSGTIARATGKQAEHIRAKGFDNHFYIALLLEMISEHGPVSRAEIDSLLMDKLPESLSEAQKKNKIHYFLGKLRDADEITNRGSRSEPQWVAVTKETSKLEVRNVKP